jgi:hypothetical protein
MVLVEEVKENRKTVKCELYRRFSMTTEEIIISIFIEVDDQLPVIPKHTQAKLYPSELLTIGILFALKGVGFRAFYRWLKRDYEGLFAGLPERTRLQRLLKTHQAWCQALLAQPSFFTVIDSYPIELIFPVREGRSPQQIGKKGKDKGRWSIGIKLCWLLNDQGRVVRWGWNTLNTPDQAFNPLIEELLGQTIVLSDLGFRDQEGIPDNLKLCPKGTWNERMVVETALSMVTTVCHLKKISHRLTAYVQARLAFVVAMFNILLGLFHKSNTHASPFQMSIAEFSL